MLECSHSFCENCIEDWLGKNENKQCPMCRVTVGLDLNEIMKDSVKIINDENLVKKQ